MKVTRLSQDSTEWEEWRNTGLGASDAATILGESPYKTAYGLWLEKTGRKPPPDLSNVPNVKRGKALEPLARQYAEKYIGQKLYPLCASEEIEDFILTSFDGITSDNRIVAELKCPHPTTFLDVKRLGKESKAYKLYWYQAQQQLYVSKAEKCYLIFFQKGIKGKKSQLAVFTIYPDHDFHKSILIPALKDFWLCIKNDVEPIRDPKRDPCVVSNVKTWADLADVYLPIKREIKELEKKLADLQSKAKAHELKFSDLMGQNSKANECGINVVKIEKKGVDKDAVVDELLQILSNQGINLTKEVLSQKHSTKAKPYFRFSLSK